MINTTKLISLIALCATILPSMLAFAGMLNANIVNWTALLGTIVWFAVTPLWMGRELPGA